MKKTWIVLADRTEAKLLEVEGRSLVLRKELSHPEGRLHDGDIDTDRPGRAFDSHGQGRHAMERSQSPHEHEGEKFAKEIAGVMGQGRTESGVQRFVLVAEPGFLGQLRAALDSKDAALVDGTIRKELTRAKDDVLKKALSEILPMLA